MLYLKKKEKRGLGEFLKMKKHFDTSSSI